MYLLVLSILLSSLYYYMGFYAYFVQKDCHSNRIFLLLTILFSGWSLSGAFFNTMNIPEFSEVWMFVSYFIWTIGTALILHFCMSLGNVKGHLKIKTLAGIYVPAAVLLIGMLAVKGLVPSNAINFTPVGIVFGIPGGIAFYCLYICISIIYLVKMGQSNNELRIKSQSRLISFGLVAASICIAIYGFILPVMVSKPLPVLLPIFPTFWIVSMWISITKYGFLTLTMEVATRKILDNIQEIIILADKRYVIIDVNRKFEETVGIAKENINGKVLHEVLSSNQALLQQIESVLMENVPFHQGDVELCYENDKCIPIRTHVTPIVDHLGQIIGVVIAANDLSLEKEFERMSITDSLTNAYNRMKIERVINRLLMDDISFSLILGDLDFFKKINDTFGHAAGDHVLISTVSLINSELRATDYIGRWGGEEFLIILPETDNVKAFQISERIREAISTHDFGLNGNVTISLGVSEFNGNDMTLNELVQHADLALYEAKLTGRNKTVMYSEVK